MLLKKLHSLLKNREFISVATCDLKGQPNAAPKFLLKIEEPFLYLVDYTIGRTWENLKVNPRISMSFSDVETLFCYQINGAVEIIEGGAEYDKISHELLRKEIDLSARRIIEGLSTQKKHHNFEAAIANRYVIFKVRMKDVIETCPTGQIKRQAIS